MSCQRRKKIEKHILTVLNVNIMERNRQQRVPRKPQPVKRLKQKNNSFGIYKGVDTLKPDGKRYHRNGDTFSKKLSIWIT